MNLTEAASLARGLMNEHLQGEGWHFEYNRSKRAFGTCKYVSKTICLSDSLVSLNDEAKVRETILHEIAHALCGYQAGHGPVWVRQARALGIKGDRCYTVADTNVPKGKYYLECPHCGKKTELYRKPTRTKGCGDCCRKYSGGRYSDKFRMTLVQRRG